MAKKKPSSNAKSLVIVESPAKARTIGKFLGKDFQVEASIGHVRDLPQGKKNIPAKYRDEEWADLGVNVNEGFEPIYVISPGKSKQVNKLKKDVKASKDLYLATDEDREGEAISWHLLEILKPKVPVHRLVFHEITKEAIQEALSRPRQIDDGLVKAQEARRILDRLYGYGVSPLLWRKVRTKLSAGRVQSVAVRIIVERERERMAFVRATYWDLSGMFSRQAGESFRATLTTVDGKRLPVGKDFDAATGKLVADRVLLDERQAAELRDRIRQGTFRVATLEEKPFTSKPPKPFITSTLQQEANRKLGFTARRTMQVAQSLYENGHITYMRTDSTSLAKVAVDAARELVGSHYGQEYLHPEPRIYASKVKNAQEAHEAIRPAGHPFELPAAVQGQLSTDEFRLFELVWKRTVASQMADARGRRISITVEGEGCIFQVGGKVIDFAGFLRAYVEGSDDPHAELADKETVLPPVEVGEMLACDDLEARSHTTQPPARFSEASLTQALEDRGIGRPSTYASIIDTILNRGYVFKKNNALVPEWVAFSVVNLLKMHLPTLIDYEFTAKMEDDLDAISRGEAEQVEYLRGFYFGNGAPGLRRQLDHKLEEIDARQIGTIPIGKSDDGQEIAVRVGRYAPFIESGERRATLPEALPPDELTVAKAVELLEQSAKAEEPLGSCPETGKPVFLKIGRFGPYVQRGTLDDEEKPKNASLLKGIQPEDVNLELALKLLSLPRELGPHPQSGQPIQALNGRFGPYVKCGDDSRSLGPDLSPLDVTLDQAVHLLAQPKTGRGRAKPDPIKKFDKESPVTGNEVQVLDGRYGPYVTDGETNASVPKGTDALELAFDAALQLLADRAAQGPPKRRSRKKTATKTTKKTTAKKKSTTKKRASKQAVKKKSAKQAPASTKRKHGSPR